MTSRVHTVAKMQQQQTTYFGIAKDLLVQGRVGDRAILFKPDLRGPHAAPWTSPFCNGLAMCDRSRCVTDLEIPTEGLLVCRTEGKTYARKFMFSQFYSGPCLSGLVRFLGCRLLPSCLRFRSLPPPCALTSPVSKCAALRRHLEDNA